MNRGYEVDSLREALTRYVPIKAVDERFEELKRRNELRMEALAEAKKEAMSREQSSAERGVRNVE